MKKINIKYVDWWDGFDYEKYRIQEILEEYFEVEITDHPDFVISSVYSKEALKYDCVRVFYSGENFCPDFNLFDYGIGFDHLENGDRYIWYPNYLMNPKYDIDVRRMLTKHINVDILDKTDFCCFIVSNGKADVMRDTIFDELSKYKKVNSGGRYRNNIGLTDGVVDKYLFQRKHKFAIAFENSSHPGYATEKVVQAFAAGCIPIYWGDPEIGRIFNTKAMVVVNDGSNIEKAIKHIKEIDRDDDLYLEMLHTPALVDDSFIEKVRNDFRDFIVSIFNRDKKDAYRRPQGEMVKCYYRSEPTRIYKTVTERIKGVLGIGK